MRGMQLRESQLMRAILDGDTIFEKVANYSVHRNTLWDMAEGVPSSQKLLVAIQTAKSSRKNCGSAIALVYSDFK